MAERKPGVVKPPVIDLTARPADPAAPDAGKPAAAEAPPTATGPSIEAKPTAQKSQATPEKTTKPGAARPESKPAASTPEPATKPAAAAATADHPAKPAPAARRRSRWLPAGIGVVGGAMLGIAACYGIAVLGYWPSVPDSRVDDLAQRLTQMEQTGA